MKLKADNDFFMLVEYDREPKFHVGQLIEHSSIGVVKVLTNNRNKYYLQVIVWVSESLKKAKIGNIPQHGSFRDIEDKFKFTAYTGTFEELQLRISENTLVENKKV
jgi:hypothetical protein